MCSFTVSACFVQLSPPARVYVHARVHARVYVHAPVISMQVLRLRLALWHWWAVAVGYPKLRNREYDPLRDTWLILSEARTRIRGLTKDRFYVMDHRWARCMFEAGCTTPIPVKFDGGGHAGDFPRALRPNVAKKQRNLSTALPSCGCLGCLASLPPWHPWLEFTDNKH